MPDEIKLHVRMVDDFNVEFSKEFEMVATTFAQAETDAPDVLTALGNLIAGRILSFTVKGRTNYTDVVDTGANVDEGVTLSVRKADQDKGVLKFPTPIKANYVNPDRTVDILDPAILAWFTLFTAGSAHLLFSDGEFAQDLLSGTLDT